MAVHRKIEGDTLFLLQGEQEILKIEESFQDGRVTLKLTGTLRSDTEHDFRDELTTLTLLGLDIILDLSGVTYISAACQQLLLAIQQKMDRRRKGSLVLQKLTPALLAELEKTGLPDLLMIE